jgi:hypothetical protein
LWQSVSPYPVHGTASRLFLIMTISNKKVKELLDEYKNDPVTFRLKYGSRAESDLLETAHKKGMTKEVEKKTAKHGGKMKKKYQSQGKVGRGLSDELMEYTAKYPRGDFMPTPHKEYRSFRDPTPIKRGEKSSITELRMKAVQGELNDYNTLPKIKKLMEEEGIYDTEDSLVTALSTGTKNAIAKDLLKAVKSAGAGVRRAIEERTKPQYQYGGMADMSAAPMIKQPQRKKRKASGFRTKYSKGGGVRSSKYKL